MPTTLIGKIRAHSPLNSFALKMLMAALMLLDHIHLFVPDAPYWFHQLGRLVAPVFVFLMTEGMVHTRSREKYLLRLYVAAGVMQAGNFALQLLLGKAPANNIFLSLALAATAIHAIDCLKTPHQGQQQAWLYAGALLLSVAGSYLVEGRYICLIGALVCYYLRKKPWLMCFAFVAAQGAYLLLLGRLWKTQGLMLFAVVFFLLYNGKKGTAHPAGKYFFYIFYPLHIWLLFILQQKIFLA